jgi:glucosylceramidase
LQPSVKNNLLMELFGNEDNSIRVSYLRISIGASDLDSAVFSYDDMPPGQTDVELEHFSLDPDRRNLIPILKEILAINPRLKIMGSPWSAPAWMKDNNNSKGGSLKPEYYSVYARYFVKYLQQMKAEGINIDAITPQNEPLHPGNNPSMYMTAAQEGDFIKNHLGPAFRTEGLKTKIVIYDHNCDRPDYPLEILNDAAAKPFVDGSAFHLYAGDISALSQVHNAHPDKHVYFTEQWTGGRESFKDNLDFHIKNIIIGSMRNWSRLALEWNLASDPAFKPHTPGGCTECKGALTIGSEITRNASYYIIAHASKFVPPGSVRIGSNITGKLHNVAFRTPQGKKVLIVGNDGAANETFNIRTNNKWVTTTLPAGSVGTYIW